MKQNKILAIIPARGGSIRLPKKNIKKLNGKHMIIYTIEAALQSKYQMRVIVTTDDKEIARISKKHGAEVPFIRPKELAQDKTPTLPVLQHALKFLNTKEDYYPDIMLLLQPTSPLRKGEHIDEAMNLFFREKPDSVVSLCKVKDSPYLVKKINKDGAVVPFINAGGKYVRRQNFPELYRLNGAIYITRVDIIIKENKILGEHTKAYIMKEEDSIDIDTEMDFKLAEMIVKDRMCSF